MGVSNARIFGLAMGLELAVCGVAALFLVDAPTTWAMPRMIPPAKVPPEAA
jgi:hypothetical protein